MTTTTYTTGNPPTVRSLAAVGATAGIAASLLTTYGAHGWVEIAVTVPVVLATAAIVFGVVVPRALRKESAGGTALALSIPAVLLLLPAFWAGLPLVLGLGGLVVGNAGRSARTGAGACIAALVLGGLAVVGYLAIYATEIGAGNGGFLFG